MGYTIKRPQVISLCGPT